VRFVQARLPLEREGDFEPVDLLISSKVLEYVDDLDHILAQFSRLVKPGSALVLSLPNLASLSRAFQRVKFKLTGEPEIYRHIRHYSLSLLLRLRLKQYGLMFAETRYYTHATRSCSSTSATTSWPSSIFPVWACSLSRRAWAACSTCHLFGAWELHYPRDFWSLRPEVVEFVWYSWV
jgi:hypothetical protein